jgi:hypothetical protein
MTQIPSQRPGSHEAREQKPVQPAVMTPGVIRKAPIGRRIRDNLFAGSARDVWMEMFWNTFVGGIADSMADAFHAGVDTAFRGQAGSGGGYRTPSTRFRSNRSSQIMKHNPDRALGGGAPTERFSRDARVRQDTSVVEYASRAEAENVLQSLNLAIDQFDIVTLAEFYELSQITPEHTDYKFGWDSLGGASVVHSRGGYFLDLPPVIQIK